jgi:hypothetical protein
MSYGCEEHGERGVCSPLFRIERRPARPSTIQVGRQKAIHRAGGPLHALGTAPVDGPYYSLGSSYSSNQNQIDVLVGISWKVKWLSRAYADTTSGGPATLFHRESSPLPALASPRW